MIRFFGICLVLAVGCVAAVVFGAQYLFPSSTRPTAAGTAAPDQTATDQAASTVGAPRSATAPGGEARHGRRE